MIDDMWTDERLAQVAAMTPTDRAHEFDARVAAGHRLAEVRLAFNTPRLNAAEIREAFITGAVGFEAFEAHDIFPLLAAPATDALPRPVPPAPPPPSPAERDDGADGRDAWARAVERINARLAQPQSGP
ncbi:hypothetical protein [uncultured Alsobacter sp.]|uniref:hypothetical protein n=1 Tax=uncultured Alsobacter sp. TaxID=1748258 RepID=UPI0025E8A0D3|nr:hypothetical protein [uncultured Alsobacter sp.]